MTQSIVTCTGPPLKSDVPHVGRRSTADGATHQHVVSQFQSVLEPTAGPAALARLGPRVVYFIVRARRRRLGRVAQIPQPALDELNGFVATCRQYRQQVGAREEAG